MGKVPKPNIIWRGANPNNFTYGRPGAGRDGRNTFHHVVGSAESAVIVFNQPTRGASSHFVVTDQPGVIFQCVDINDTAWCDANWESNLRTISMEHHGDWRNGYDNPVVRENSALLVAWLRENYGVNRPIRHRDVSLVATACPADLPVEAIWNRSSDIINSYNQPVDTRPQWLKDRQPASGVVYAQTVGIFLHNLNNPDEAVDSRRFVLNQSFEIGSYTVVGGVKYYITKSSTDLNAPNGLRENEVAFTPYVPPVEQPIPQPPVTETPTWHDSVVDELNQTLFVLRPTVLIDLELGRPKQKDGKEIWYQAGDIIENVSAHAIVAEVTYSLTEYSFQQTAAGKYGNASGIKSSDLTTDPLACPPGTPANPTPPVEPEDPVEPMPDVPEPPTPDPKDDEQDKRLTAIEAFIELLKKAWRAIFNRNIGE